MTMSDTRPQPETQEPDILAELQAEVAQELADDRPPAGGAAYQIISAVVVLVLGAVAAVLAYGYGLGSLRRPGPGLWPFVVSIAITALAVTLLVVGRRLDDAEKFTRASLLVLAGSATFVGLGLLLPVHRLRDPRDPARHRLAALPRRRDLAQHHRDLGLHDRRRSTCSSSTPCASRSPTCSPSGPERRPPWTGTPSSTASAS